MNLISILKNLFQFFQKSPKQSNSQSLPKEEVYMLSMSELLKGKKLEDQSEEIQVELNILLERINKIRKAYGKPMTVTSGLRTMEDHLRIYRQIAERKGLPFDESKVPKKSKHLFGQAVDIADPKQDLQKWCTENETLLEEVGLWMEDFSATSNWCHFQTVAPASGKRWFKP
jgi:uncharacterized protein YcbK (DUF882 family)